VKILSEIFQIIRIIKFEDYIKESESYKHIFEVQFPSENLKGWNIKYDYSIGTPLIGDLIMNNFEDKSFEMHPFPEWVVQLINPHGKSSKAYLIVPNLDKSFIKKMLKKNIDNKVELLKNFFKSCTIENIIAFEYQIGVNVMIPAYIPHTFICSKEDLEKGLVPAYFQVFEPNFENIVKSLKIKPTQFFRISFSFYI